jgi:hypothetical protein
MLVMAIRFVNSRFVSCEPWVEPLIGNSVHANANARVSVESRKPVELAIALRSVHDHRLQRKGA